MKKFLNSIRKKEDNLSLKKMIFNSSLIFLFGILLGVLSKYLDNASFNNSILNYLDLGNFFSSMPIWLFIAIMISVYSKSPIRASINVFLFFIGMVTGYYVYTINVNGFNPQSYMMTWYKISFISPFLAFICWYSKSENKLSIIVKTVIIWIMLNYSFSIGLLYFDFRGILYTLTFISTLIVLYDNYKNTLISLLIGLFLAFSLTIPLINLY